MRLDAIKINGFRGFGTERILRLDANAVVVFGANGRGKTSLFDAVLWALTGSVPRLPGDDAAVISKYSSTGEARVELSLRDADETLWRVTRRFDGTEQHVVLDVPTGREQGPEAKLSLLKKLWPDSMFTGDSTKAVTMALTRSVYLQQDVVREFIESTPDDAFRAISELVGTGRVTELQAQLERSKTAWTRATNERSQELASLREVLEELEEQLKRETSGEDQGALMARWGEWWARVQLFTSSRGAVPAVASAEAGGALNVAIRELEAARHARERRRDLAAQVMVDIDSHSPTTADPTPLLAALNAARAVLDADRKALEEAEHRASEGRKAAVERRDAVEELRTLAAIALRHLEEECPVCRQPYDRETTRARLEALVAQAAEANVLDPAADEVRRLAALVEAREKECTELLAKHRAAEDSARQERLWRLQVDERLRELGLVPAGDEIRAALSEHLDNLRKALADVATLQSDGEALALAVARAGEAARRAEVAAQAGKVRKEADVLSALVKERTETGELAAGIIDALREAGSEIVKTRLERLEPLLQRLYETIDPHPSFKAVRILSRPFRGRGKVITSVADADKQVSSEAPGAVLSSSQMNALAVSVFLALNLAISTMPLNVMMLDDPLQTLDEINLLGLVDLLRRVRERRQIIVSTHDIRWARLLERKLRPVHSAEHARVIEFRSWNREGPDVVEREVPADVGGLRVVA